MTAPVFVDTSILVSSRDASEGERQSRAEQWMTHLWRSHTGRVSYSVLLEFYLTVTRKLQPGMPEAMAREEVRDFLTWRPIPLERTVIEGAWALVESHALRFWDAAAVAAAQFGDCRYLLTGALRHGRRFGPLEVVNPFEDAGPSYLVHEAPPETPYRP
jgi:predicted nucleic acid-binding protein